MKYAQAHALLTEHKAFLAAQFGVKSLALPSGTQQLIRVMWIS